jgi:plasmid maintenance system antidote protein VapI
MKKTIIKHASPIYLALMMLIISGGLMGTIPTLAETQNGGDYVQQSNLNHDWLWRGTKQVKRGMHAVFGNHLNLTILENQTTKYNLDPQLLQDIITKQQIVKNDLDGFNGWKRYISGDGQQLQEDMKQHANDLNIAINKFHEALQKARVEEAQNLGINQQIIDEWVKDQNNVKGKMAYLLTLRMQNTASVDEIKQVKIELEEATKQARESRKIFNQSLKRFDDKILSENDVSMNT